MTNVTVILPTYNRLDRLKQVLAGLERQQYPLSNFDVVVISDGSTDGTHEYLASIKTPLNLVAAIQKNQGPAAARNKGIELATGEIVLFIDDDVVPSPQLLAEHMRLHAQEADLIVLGPMLTPPDVRLSPWVQWEQDMLVKQYRAMEEGAWAPTARQFYTGNTSLARRHLVEVGGFDARYRRAEDIELAYRLARRPVRFVFHPAAIGYHYAERSFRSWIEIPYTYGRNDVAFAREGEAWILEVLPREFRERNPLITSLVRLCLDRKALSGATLTGLKLVAQLNGRAGLPMLSRFVHSAMFNLRYYQGVADALGGRAEFLSAASAGR